MKDTRQEVIKLTEASKELINAWNKKAFGSLSAMEYQQIEVVINELNYIIKAENN